MIAQKVIKELNKVSSKEKAKSSARFFKTADGEYGAGDKFIGVSVPEQRKIAQMFYSDIDLVEIKKLLTSSVHEHRFTALEILCLKYEKSSNEKFKKSLVKFYINNSKFVNNWDLVDTSAYPILGEFLIDKKDRSILYKLSLSNNLWQKRISIIATYAFIKRNDFTDTFKISKNLLSDSHDLIHKAVGWMLREVGKRSLSSEEAFLRKHLKVMPRTTLRYAIERFPKEKYYKYLNSK